MSSYAAELDNPRWLDVLPNGDCSSRNHAPERPDERKGSRLLHDRAQQKAGAGKQADRITLRARRVTARPNSAVGPEGPHSPVRHGAGRKRLLRRDTDAVAPPPPPRPIPRGLPFIDGSGTKSQRCGRDHHHHCDQEHIASQDANVCRHSGSTQRRQKRMENEERSAARLRIDPETARRVFSRPDCAPMPDWSAERRTGTAVDERDEIGNYLVPDYMTSGKTAVLRLAVQLLRRTSTAPRAARPDLVEKAIVPNTHSGKHCIARARFYRATAAARYRGGRVRRPARLVESPAPAVTAYLVPFPRRPSGDKPEEILRLP